MQRQSLLTRKPGQARREHVYRSIVYTSRLIDTALSIRTRRVCTAMVSKLPCSWFETCFHREGFAHGGDTHTHFEHTHQLFLSLSLFVLCQGLITFSVTSASVSVCLSVGLSVCHCLSLSLSLSCLLMTRCTLTWSDVSVCLALALALSLTRGTRSCALYTETCGRRHTHTGV